VEPIEQGEAEMGFQRLDLVADRRGRDSELGRGGFEAAHPRGHFERAQGVQREGRPEPISIHVFGLASLT
jgi:hypothetical protein